MRAATWEAIARTPVGKRLQTASALVLERIAFGAGETCWYFCETPSALEALVRELRPGSILCFYFDGRFERHLGSAAVNPARALLTRTGEALVGLLAGDRFHIEMNMVGAEDELMEAVNGMAEDVLVFVGVFPAPDNDGIAAVTMTVPDLDGITRAHPH